MEDWPTASLIRIIKGYDSGKLREGVIAFKCNGGNSYRGNNCHIARGYPRDSIDEWEEVTVVPTATLKHLQDMFRGADIGMPRIEALLEVTSYLAADEPSALDQAVAKVKDLSETPLILKGFPQEYDLALLLESLAALPATVHKGLALAKIVLACTTWVDFLSLSDGSLDHVRELAESDADRAEFTDMVRIAGDIASNIDDGAIGQQKRNLLTVAQCALAWLAELIEKEEA